MWPPIWALPPGCGIGIVAAGKQVGNDAVGMTRGPDVHEEDMPVWRLANISGPGPKDARMVIAGATAARLPSPFSVMMSS